MFFKNKKRLLKIFKTTLVILLLIGVERFCHKRTGGFALHKIVSDLSFCDQPLPPEKTDIVELRSILNQPFTYLGRGAQCYAFLSQDQKYVLKFIRFDHLRPSFWLTHLPVPSFLKSYRDKKILLSQEKTARTFESYKIAYQDLKEESGLISVHLHPSDDLNLHTAIIDKIGIAHPLDMDSMQFILQRRARLIYPTISQMMENKCSEQAQDALKELLTLLAARCKKGIADKDPDIRTNFGFIQDRPIQIDVGRFSRQTCEHDDAYYRNEIMRITDQFNAWLKHKYPELSIYLQEQICTLSFNEIY
jgi:hypothetical protein